MSGLMLSQRIVTRHIEADAKLLLSRLSMHNVPTKRLCAGLDPLALRLLKHRALVVTTQNGLCRLAHVRETEAMLRARRERYGPGTMFGGMENG